MTRTEMSTTIHPIVNEASALLVGQAKDLALSPGAEQQLRRSLFKLQGSPELALAVRSLIALAAHVELDHGAVRCADELLALAAAASGAVVALNDQAEKTKDDAVRRKRRNFTSFSGRQEKTRAPHFGARGLQGSLRASTMRIPAVFR